MEYIFEWKIVELDCFWHKTECCCQNKQRKNMENTGLKKKKSIFLISKFSAPTIAFLAFWLAKKLQLWANSQSFTSYGK